MNRSILTITLLTISLLPSTYVQDALSTTVSNTVETNFSEVPTNFHYDKTLIIPGNFAFIALPFIKQLPMGICAAASSLNVIKYIDPEINLGQTDLFKTFNSGQDGATFSQISGGMISLGFTTETHKIENITRNDIEFKIIESLDNNRPVLVEKPGHFLTIIGYNRKKAVIIAWDQAKANSHHESDDIGMAIGLPQGAYETNVHEFTKFMFLKKKTMTISPEEEEFIKRSVGNYEDFQKHILVNSNARAEKTEQFYLHSHSV